MTSPQKHVIVLVGPTASGKTAIAIELAKHFKTEIISADSRQCYKEMKIGVARPSIQELAEVPHHFIASHSIEQELTAADFEKLALEKVEGLFLNHEVVIMVGGTGLYIQAFCEGLDPIPVIDPGVRKRIRDAYENYGIEWLEKELRKKDPQFADAGEMKNPHRMMRALEVKEGTGQSIVEFQKGKKTDRPFKIHKIGLELSREALKDHIDKRVDQMMKQGLLDEVKTLLPFRQFPALRTVGYSELFEFLDKKISLEEAVIFIKIHTRQYAKRQLTWFRRDEEIKWFHPSELERIVKWLELKVEG